MGHCFHKQTLSPVQITKTNEGQFNMIQKQTEN
jgi:hypothetical protein